MALLFAGVPLTPEAATGEWASWVRANIQYKSIYPFERFTWGGASQSLDMDPDLYVEPNVLKWRVGASRWADMHVIVSEGQKQAIQQAAPSGSGALEMSWYDAGNGDSLVDKIKTTMGIVAFKPLNQLTFGGPNSPGPPVSEAMWLMTLADDRYDWWYQYSAHLAVADTSLTWPQVFTKLMQQLSVAATQDAIATPYNGPKVDTNAIFEFVPTALDAAAFYFGQRITRSLNGTVQTRGPLGAKLDAQVNVTRISARSRRGGGQFVLKEMNYTFPTTVRVSFPRSDGAKWYSDTTTFTALALPDLKGISTNGDTKDFISTLSAVFAGGSVTNQSTLDAFTAQMATDYYRWTQLLYDVKWHGIVSLNPDGFHDIEWVYRLDEVSTRMIPYQYEILFSPPPPQVQPTIPVYPPSYLSFSQQAETKLGDKFLSPLYGTQQQQQQATICGATGPYPYVISIYCDPLLGFVVTTGTLFFIKGDLQNDTFTAIGGLSTRTNDTSGVFTFDQQCTAAAVASGGSGYVVGDVLQVVGGACTTIVKLQITSVSAGVVTAASVVVPGLCSTPPSNAVSVTGGTGTGATFNLTFTTNPLTTNQVLRFYWTCGYQDVTIGSVTGNTTNFTGTGTALPVANTLLTAATTGGCC